ncbi:DUF5753 domain-containing protein, partial [Actinokineospora sp.]|uniref:DUF5753 domain-containing protein n=1 Tax=Actinokineospora sp. TaxID=1872133 RepID=UPI00403795FE
PEQRQQMSAFLDYEQNATAITEVAPLLIPGLLQTTDYIRTIMSTGGSVPQVDIPTRIAIRVGRREVITRQNPARLLALIGQAALCQDIGGKAVMAAQLRHLVEMARRPNVELRVVPFGVGWHPALDGSFALIDPDSPTSAVFLETRRTTLWLHKADDVRAYKSAVDTLLRTAMNLDDSIRFTAAMAERMESRE